jgi:hypothetical protein
MRKVSGEITALTMLSRAGWFEESAVQTLFPENQCAYVTV